MAYYYPEGYHWDWQAEEESERAWKDGLKKDKELMDSLVIPEELKTELFTELLRLEELAEEKTYDGRNYAEQSNGAFIMLGLLGLDHEYIEWTMAKAIKEKMKMNG